MKRLTERDKSGAVNIIRLPDDGMKSIYELLYNTQAYLLNAALNKLADYEDAEEQGRFVKLPCKVGGTVYEICEQKIAGEWITIVKERIVEMIKVSHPEIGIWLCCGCLGETLLLPASKIGKTVFLTRDEAEKALKGVTECTKS